MPKIAMLKIENSGTIDLYNTYFAIQNQQDVFLIDTEGSIEIIYSLYYNRISKKIFCFYGQ